MKKIFLLFTFCLMLGACTTAEVKQGTEDVVGGTGKVIGSGVVGASKIIQNTGRAISEM
jgi:hypothetical protein